MLTQDQYTSILSILQSHGDPETVALTDAFTAECKPSPDTGYTFNSPHDPVDPRNGQAVTILDSRMTRVGGKPDVLHTVRFPDGFESDAWDDEITPSPGYPGQ